MTDVDAIAASLGTSNLTSNCSLYKAYATQLSRITKVKPIVASLNSQITELLVRNHFNMCVILYNYIHCKFCINKY